MQKINRMATNYTGNKTQFNRDFIIRYFPDTEDRHYNELIGLDTFKRIVGNMFVSAKILKRLEKNRTDKHSVSLRRGIRFEFVSR